MRRRFTAGSRRSTYSNFLLAQNTDGNWVAQEPGGLCGGVFTTRDAAMRFALTQTGERPEGISVLSGNLELRIATDPHPVARRVKPI